MKKPIFNVLAVLLFCTPAFAQNYDETLVAPYNLPDPLTTSRGQIVMDKATWENTRRPEVLALFKNEIYGQMVQTYDSLSFIFTKMDAEAMQGKATQKEVQITVWKVGKPVKINLLYFIPNQKPRPAPLFLFINNRDKKNTDPARSEKS